MRSKTNPSGGGDAFRRLMARIHIAKKELALDEAEYRTILKAQTGKDSCSRMSLGELMQVEHYLKKTLGWKPKTAGGRMKPGKKRSPVSQGRPVDVLRAIWIEMAREGLIRDGSETALEAWVVRMSARLNHGKGIERVDWLDAEPYVCQRLIESLKQWQKRLAAKVSR